MLTHLYNGCSLLYIFFGAERWKISSLSHYLELEFEIPPLHYSIQFPHGAQYRDERPVNDYLGPTPKKWSKNGARSIF